MIGSLQTSLSGMISAGKKLSVTAQNIVNAASKGSTDPAAKKQSYLAMTTVDTGVQGGVKTAVVLRQPATVLSYDPDQEFADENGMVNAPNVDLAEELILGKQAEQAYKANAIVMARSQDLHDELMRAVDRKV
jgi:flagellar basal-body rod protein FlgC